MRDLFTGRLTYRRLDVLLRHLPPESAYQTALREQLTDAELAQRAAAATGHGAWSRSDMLLAALIDSVGVLTHVQIARAGVKADPPEPLSRPGVSAKRAQAANPQTLAYLQSIRDKHDQTQTEGG